jgi:CheY-like chemotaxis protein
MIHHGRKRPAPAVMPPRRHSPPPGRGGGRILVVDDHVEARDLLLTLLKTEGYDVVLAEPGTAVARYRERPADIVLMDLPDMDGVAAIRALGSEFPGVVIVAMSGDDGSIWGYTQVNARTAGAQITLRKPLEPWLLLRAIEGLMAARRTLSSRTA